jgi:hypothetical protein
MQPFGFYERATTRRLVLRRRVLVWCGGVAVLTLALVSSAPMAATARAKAATPTTVQTGASNGGTANASSGGNVNIGEIVTGENTGNSISTGNIAGEAQISGGDIDYPTDVNVTLEIGPPIADASGGDGGQAAGPTTEPPQYNVNIDNTDKNRNDNRSEATGIGEGGEGGQGGEGGSVTIGGDTTDGTSG